ncbi:MAG: hypothetical protein WD358_02075 [Nitriliruptoraceae bacterium]
MTRFATMTGIAVLALVAASCGVKSDVFDTISGMTDALSDARDIAPGPSTAPVDDTDPPEWSDYPEVERFCGATWTRDEMIAAYEAQGLSGLPVRVGFSGTFANEIAEFHNRWRVSQVIAAARAQRDEAGLDRRELITCIVGTVGPQDPREAFGVNILYINDHSGAIETPTLVGVEINLSLTTDDGPQEGPRVADAAARWVGACPRNVILPPGGGYTQARCLLDGPEGLTDSHIDAPDGLPDEGCPDADFSCSGLVYTPSRDAFVEILADPDLRYTFSTSSRTRWIYSD